MCFSVTCQVVLVRDTAFINVNNLNPNREYLLSKIIDRLANDDRFVAGWLTGSLSRDDADALSDIDISLVVANEYSSTLCNRLEQVSAQTSLERFTFLSQFGKISLIHENNYNAPEGSTFTFTLYADVAIGVDWILIPQDKAQRPVESKLLFDKVGISILSPLEPESVESNKSAVAERWAFFWMMTAITIKYLHRGDGVFVNQWLENLYRIIQEIERHLERKPWEYKHGSLSNLQPTQEKQVESIKELIQRAQRLKPEVTIFLGSEPATPLEEIEFLLSITNY